LGSETSDGVRQLCERSGRVLQSIVEDAVFDGLKYHAICSLDLAVAAWMGHQGVVDIDEAVIAKVPEVRLRKGLPQVGDNPVGYPELVGDVFDELRSLFRRDCGDGADLNLLGEFFYCHQDVVIATRGHLEGSHRVKAPYGKGLGRWNCPQNLSQDVLLFGKELATLTPPNQVLHISQGGGSVEA
jgi:hypothetical protein